MFISLAAIFGLSRASFGVHVKDNQYSHMRKKNWGFRDGVVGRQYFPEFVLQREMPLGNANYPERCYICTVQTPKSDHRDRF